MARPTSAKTRLIISIVAGLAVALVLILLGAPTFAPLGAWDTAALLYVGWVWRIIWHMDAAATKSHAQAEDPSRTTADVLLIAASVVSLIAVGFIIMQAGGDSGAQKAVEIGLGLLSVVVSWGVVHTTYTVKYSDLYYRRPEGGIDFNESNAPKYTDFAYLAFTIGMTFQVSDTNLETKEIRTAALRHALLSYLFGALIIATTINTVANLGK